MSKLLRLKTLITKQEQEEDGDLVIEGIASTSNPDRMNDMVLGEGWQLDNFKANPILLFNHNYNEPIGSVDEIEVTENGLWVKARICKACEKITALVKSGVLRTFSVGFLAHKLKYVHETDGFIIEQSELLELSVVSVPANTDAVFSVAKQLDSKEVLKLKEGDELNNSEQDAEAGGKNPPTKDLEMTKEEIEKMMADIAAKTAQSIEEKAAKEAREKAEREAAEKAEQERLESVVKHVSVSVTENTNKLVEDLQKRLDERLEKENGDIMAVVGELKGQLEEYGTKITANRRQERIFDGHQAGSADWKKEFEKDLDDAWVLGRATKKGYDTEFAKQLMEKVNTHSGIEVSSEDFEQIVSTRVEREIQNRLVLAPLFSEVPMTSASQILPILPDAGYAEFTTNTTASGSAPHGNLAQRGDAYGTPWGGVDLDERTLTTKKIISRTYLGNETEEDAILPILPLIRESIVRSHARTVEAAMLVGNHADGPFGVGGASFAGLVTMAAGDSNDTQVAGTLANYAMTAADLLAARKNMGKYGVNARDVVYIVNQQSWFELLEDPEFQDVNLVGQNEATKLTGEVGRIFGTPVLLCDEFAAPAVSKYFALALNKMNYVVPRLRGVTLESDYETGEQRTVLVASQRLGFQDIFDGASSVWALQYPGS